MKNVMMILATMIVFVVACGNPKQVEVEQLEPTFVEIETDLEEVEDVEQERPTPVK